MTRIAWAVLLCATLVPAAEPPGPRAGQPLADALKLLEREGLAVVYSSELVRPDLKVLRDPRGGTPREVLEEILAPHGLALRPGPAGRLLVVRAPRPPAPREEAAVPSPPPPSFASGVELVTVDVVVLDERGEPLRGLGPEDFTVQEDGVVQRVTSFEAIAPAALPERPEPARRPHASTNRPAPEGGRLFVVVFDEVHMSPLHAERAKEALAEFLRAGLGGGDQVLVVPTGGGGSWKARMDAGRRDLVAFLRHLKGLRPEETSACTIGEHDALLFYKQRDRAVEARLVRWLNECNPTLDPPVVALRGGGAGREGQAAQAEGDGLRAARQRRADLDVAPGRGQLMAAAAEVYERANHRRRRTLGTLTRVLAEMESVRGRKVVLLVSEGFIDEPGLLESREVALASRRANAAVYFLDARTSAPPAAHSVEAARLPEGRDATGFFDEQGRLDDGAESIAAQTGGRVLRGGLGDAWHEVEQESRACYLLGYQPTNARRDGTLRKLRIDVGRPGVRVRARPGYYAASDKPTAGEGVRGVPDLALGSGSLPLRLAAYVRGPGAPARARTLLVAEVDARQLGLPEGEGRLAGPVDAFVVVVSRDTGTVWPVSRRVEVSLPAEPGEAWLPIPSEVELPPGTYQGRMVVRGRGPLVGAIEHEFVVPPSGLRISTPILTDRVDHGGRPTPIAHTRFPRKGRLYCQFEVYGGAADPQTSAPRLSARHVLRRSDGSVASGSDFTPLATGDAGVPARMLAISLESAVPGAYDLTLEVRDDVSGQTRQVQEAYVVEDDVAPSVIVP